MACTSVVRTVTIRLFVVIGSVDAKTFAPIELIVVVAVVVIALRLLFVCKVDRTRLALLVLLLHSVFDHFLNKSLQLFVHRLLRIGTRIILTTSQLSRLPVGTHFLRLIEHNFTGAQIMSILAMQGTVLAIRNLETFRNSPDITHSVEVEVKEKICQ